jgi:hypothetical protein
VGQVGDLKHINQYAALRLQIAPWQLDAVREAMTPYSGITIRIEYLDGKQDAFDVGDALRQALQNAGITVIGPLPAMIFSSPPVPSGLSLDVGRERQKAGNALATALGSKNVIPVSQQGADAHFLIIVKSNQ